MAAASMVALELAAHRWWPAGGRGAPVLEMDEGVESLDQLCSALASVKRQLDGCKLIVVRVSIPSGAELMEAMSAAHGLRLPAHVCLAIDSGLLGMIVGPVRNVDRVGLMLDGVNAATPLAHIANEALEAVRFDIDFAARADSHLRSRCVLDALLHFTADIGLCTFGPAWREDEQEGSIKQFDYVATLPSRQ